MAKKKTETKTQIVEDVPDGTLPNSIGGIVNDGEFDLDGTDKIKVYKLLPGKTKPSFCFEFTEDITETYLQNLYGGGTYTIEYWLGNIRKRTEQWEIADKPASQQDNKPRTVEDVQIAMLREQSQMNRDLLMAVLGRGNTSTPMSEVAQMWAIMQGATPNSGGGFQNLISIFEKGLEIGATKGGDMDWKSMLVQTIKEIAPTITNVVAQAKGIPANGNPSPVLIPEQLLQTGIATLKKQILGGMPVGLALDWIVANANDPQYQPLLQQVMGKTFDDLVKIDNELANEPYNSWFRKFLEGLKEHFKEATTVEDAESE